MLLSVLFSALASAGLVSSAAVSVERRSAPKNLKVVGLSVLGSGCPSGSADVRTNSDNTALEIRLSDYTVQTGPGVGAAEMRKNCKITMNLEYDAGFSLSTLTTDLQGYAFIPSDTKGQCKNSIYFSGETKQPVNYSISLPGGTAGSFSLRSDPDVEVWSPCGGSTAILNVNTQCSISPTNSRGLIEVDHISNRLSVRVALKWRTC